MSDDQKSRGDEQGARGGREGFGDDGGTRVGRPDPARGADASTGPSSQPVSEGLEGSVFEDESDDRSDARTASGQPTGAGAEATEGKHDAMRDRSPSKNTGADAATDQTGSKGDSRRGSEPLTGSQAEHESGYGGKMGEPRTSSDQRE